MRMSMMRPIPFWPSLEPWEKLTPVQVRTRRARMGHGGGAAFFGASKRAGYLMSHLDRNNRAAAPKPTIGEIRSTLKTLVACSQSTPEVPLWTFMSWLATPTPMIEPTIVCELEAGRPNHQVLRFQTMAAMSRAKTMAKPAPALT